jgi:hypothetical protein
MTVAGRNEAHQGCFQPGTYVFRAHEWIMVLNAISNRAVEQDQSSIANMISKCDGLCEYVNAMHLL